MKKRNEDNDMIVNRDIQVKLPKLLIAENWRVQIWIGYYIQVNSKQKSIRFR